MSDHEAGSLRLPIREKSTKTDISKRAIKPESDSEASLPCTVPSEPESEAEDAYDIRQQRESEAEDAYDLLQQQRLFDKSTADIAQRQAMAASTASKATTAEKTTAEKKKDEDDPIVAEFPIFIKPGLEGDRQFIILQYPNREKSKPYDAKNNSAPLELRIKPKAGMVEVDVPMQVHNNFDRVKGINWGAAMKKSSAAKGAGSHGLPGGFGIGGAPQAGRGRGRDEAEEAENQEKLLKNYGQAVEDGHVLQVQTLGGQFFAKNSTSPTYMVGTFTNGQLHLTPVDEIVSLRPQFHHIDAANEQERLSRARDAGTPRVTEARAVHMTVKTPGEGDDNHGDDMNKRAQEVQAEPWRAHRWVDAETDEAWGFFQENFFVGGAMGQNTEELIAKVPKLISGVTDEQYLDMTSAPIDPERLKKAREAEKQARKENRKARRAKAGEKGKGKAADGDEEDDGYSSDTLSEPDGAEEKAKVDGDDETTAA